MTRTEWGVLLKALENLSTHAKACEGDDQDMAAD